MRARLWFLAAASALAGCAAPVESEEQEEVGELEAEVIVGELNWKDITELSPTSKVATRARAVGYLSIPATTSRCTAWLVADDAVVTNVHCIASQEEATGARVTFDRVEGVDASAWKWFDCGELIQAFPEVDLAVLRCKANGGALPGQLYGTLELAGSDPTSRKSIYVIHQNCEPEQNAKCSATKKYSPGRVSRAVSGATDFTYDADTLGGSSGAPVISFASHKVIGLHHSGISEKDGDGLRNSGVRVSKFRAALRSLGL